ncbi:uncharacterized protein LOC141686684 isoform X3 [Apium graveolens]|uniref:uncharacterized protein LOC141686684 isoform X3 n=1 Tax=Apium graveolens TaxID=4045 RepID=UPI003D7A7E77
MGKKKIRSGAECSEDAISRLPDELIHKILSFVDAKVAVQSSILSKRWRFIWPTLPFLNFGHVLSSLDNLQNLTAVVGESAQQDLLLSFPQLVNLSLRTRNVFQFPRFNIVVLAPKLRSFTSVGVFSITFEAPELENVYMKLQGRFQNLSFEDRETSNLRFAHMLLGLGNAKNISFDLDSMEALFGIPNYLASFPSPFRNLKCVKLPRGYKESTMSSALRSYLLGGSPRATIVSTLSQDNMIPHTAAVSVTAANELVGESLATATKELVDCQYTNKNVCFDTTDVVVQKHYAVGNSLVDANSVRQYESLVEGTSNDPGSSSRKNKDFGMWRGHEVNSEFVCLLDNIMLKYPETFEHFGAKNKKLCTMNLNMLCTSLNDFSKVSMTEVDSEIIIAYKDVCAYLQNQGFNVSWVVNRLNYIEQLRFSKPLIPELHAIDCCINDTNSKIQDLQARVDEAKSLRMQKMTEIEKAFGTLGTKLAVGFLGDDLL